jgi:integrase
MKFRAQRSQPHDQDGSYWEHMLGLNTREARRTSTANGRASYDTYPYPTEPPIAPTTISSSPARTPGKPIDRSRLLKRFKAALKAAEVRPVRFHDLRHTFGTRWAPRAYRCEPFRR